MSSVELQKDQEEDQWSARALFNNWRLRKPVVLVAGRHYEQFPFNLGEATYVVLGWYVVTHLWSKSLLAHSLTR